MERLQEIKKELIELQGDGDTEIQHSMADELICEALYLLGQFEIVDEYEKINKWYS